MDGNQYLQYVLSKSRAPTGAYGPGERVRRGLYSTISSWATSQLSAVDISGSYAKGTAIVGGTDVDLFISLKADTQPTLKEIYHSLGKHLERQGYTVRQQNVSLGITYQGLKVDLTPG